MAEGPADAEVTAESSAPDAETRDITTSCFAETRKFDFFAEVERQTVGKRAHEEEATETLAKKGRLLVQEGKQCDAEECYELQAVGPCYSWSHNRVHRRICKRAMKEGRRRT